MSRERRRELNALEAVRHIPVHEKSRTIPGEDWKKAGQANNRRHIQPRKQLKDQESLE